MQVAVLQLWVIAARSAVPHLGMLFGYSPHACPGFHTKETRAHGGGVCMQISSNRGNVGQGCIPKDEDCWVYCREHLPSSADTASREPFCSRVSGAVSALLAEQVSV